MPVKKSHKIIVAEMAQRGKFQDKKRKGNRPTEGAAGRESRFTVRNGRKEAGTLARHDSDGGFKLQVR